MADLRLGVDKIHALFIDGNEQRLWEILFRCLLQKKTFKYIFPN